MAGLDPATQQPRVGAANESFRSPLDGRLLAGHGEERVDARLNWRLTMTILIFVGTDHRQLSRNPAQ
jgi:hypothetical protein